MDLSCRSAMHKGMGETGLFLQPFTVFFLLCLIQGFEDWGPWPWVEELSQSWWGSQTPGSLGGRTGAARQTSGLCAAGLASCTLWTAGRPSC